MAQLVLGESGFDPGEIDGVYGPDTARAVKAFQAARGLDVDGLVGPATWRALRAEPTGHVLPEPPPPLLHGAIAGDDVRRVQSALLAAGYHPGDIDGIYGYRTARAVERFQVDHDLQADGVVGPATWTALDEFGLPPPDTQQLRMVEGFAAPPGAPPLLDVGFVGGRPIAVVPDGLSGFTHVDLLTGEPTGRSSSDGALSALTIPDGRPTTPVVVSGWSDGSVTVRRLADGSLIGERHIDGYDGSGPIGATAATGALLVWVPVGPGRWRAASFTLDPDLPSRADTELLTLPAPTRGTPVVFALGDRSVAAVIATRISVFSLETGAVLLDLGSEEHHVGELHVAGTPQTPLLVGLTSLGEVRRWLPTDGSSLPDLPGLAGRVAVRLATGERSLVVVPEHGALLRFDAASAEPAGEAFAVEGPDGQLVEVAAVAVADEGDTTAIAALDREGRVYAAVAGVVSGWRQPNPTVARDYWSAEDRLGYDAYARAITQFIEHADTRPPLTIGIKGAWGAGKTSVMRMVQRMLDPPIDPQASVWEFRELKLTQAARAVLTRGKGAEKEQELPATTLGTVIDRTTAAPTSDLDFGNEKATADSPRVRRPTVWFNPWMYQTGEQVWAGLAHEIITQVTGRLSPTQRERFWLELNLRRVNREELRRKIYGIVLQRLVVPGAVVAAGALVALVLAVLGLGVWVATALVPVLTGLASARANLVRLRRRPAADTLPWMVDGPVALREWDQVVSEPDYRGRAGFLYFLHADMKNVLDLVATPDRPLVVFIDDLDRCSPGVVAQTIEAVNLFLAGEFPNCIFVLAIEPAVVAAHIETAHKDLVEKLVERGMVTDWSELGWRFLEKIIQLPLGLPPPLPAVARDYVLSLFSSTDGDQTGTTDEEQRHDHIARSELARLEREAPDAGLAAIPAERVRVEQRLREQPDLDEASARQIAGEVALRRFRRSFSDDDEQVREVIVREALALPTANPREMKRLVNLFRFYALVVNERRLLIEAPSQAEVFAQVARLAALTSRWPHLLGAFATRVDAETDERGSIALERLEHAARASDDDAWHDALATCGLLGKKAQLAEPAGLCAFLRQDPPIAVLARELL